MMDDKEREEMLWIIDLFNCCINGRYFPQRYSSIHAKIQEVLIKNGRSIPEERRVK